MRALRPALVALLLSLALPGAAEALVTQTYVSGIGNDADDCTAPTPCKTWAGAISKTTAGGTITALDSGGYGAVTVTKSITLDGAGYLSSALASATNGIIVNGAGIDVTLKRLNVDSSGICTPSASSNGVRFLLGHSLTIEDVAIQGFRGSAVSLEPTDGHGTVVIRDSLFSNNCMAGVSAASPAGSGDMTVLLDDDLVTGNVTGVLAGAHSAVTLAGTTIALNTTNTTTAADGTLISHADNRIGGFAGTLGAYPVAPAPAVPEPAPTAPVTPTPVVVLPKTPPKAAVRCKVPKLTGLTLAGAKKALEHAHCRLGTVSYRAKKGAKRNRVSRQGLKTGSVRVAKTKVSVSVNGKAPHKAKAKARTAAVIGAATRAWVSAVGNDANPCSRTAPCATFAKAITQVAQNGIVNVVGNGDYGPVTIDHSLTIDGLGASVSIGVGSGTAITVAAGAGEKVTLEHLDLARNTPCAAPGAGDGIALQSGGQLLIDDVTADGFPGSGIALAPGAADGKVLVRGGSLTGNCTAGISAQDVTAIADSVLISGNATGIAAGDGGLVQLARSSITNNATGFSAAGSGQIQAWPGNATAPNGTPGFTPGTLPFS
jgi:hypothetical protein